jgi:hypothetical protein
VNDRLETTAKDVWAIGECAGSPQFTHASLDDFRIGHDLHLPDASRDPAGPAGRPRLLPDLRHGAGAGNSPTADAGPNPELIDMTRRFWIGLALTFRSSSSRWAAIFTGLHLIVPAASNWIQFVLATPVVLWAGWPFFERGWQSLSPATSTCSR